MSLVTPHWLLVTRHWSLVTGHWSGIRDHLSRFTLYVLRFTLYVFCLSLLCPAPLQAQSPDTLVEAMVRANQHYETGAYEAAIDDYETLLDSGAQHSAVYYNLGNAYYRQGDLGRAILNYRRAQLLSPRDADIAANLAVARTQTADRLDVDSGQPGLGQIVGRWFTLNEMFLLLLALWLLICIFICLAIVLPRWRKWWGWAMAGCGLLLFIGLAAILSHFYGEQQYPEAVVIVQEIEVTGGPGSSEEFAVEFTLHAGAEVQLIERRLGWRQISLPGGDLQGWLPTDAIELIEEPQS